MLATGVRRRDLLGVPEIVPLVDAVDEDDARFRIGIGRCHDPVPQATCGDGSVDLAGEDEVPGLVILHRLHEVVGDEDRKVEVAKPVAVALCLDEGLDVRMVASQRRHHRAAPGTRGHDRAAHGVPHIHERHGARGIRADALHLGALGAQCREVMSDPATLLHGEGGFLQAVEDARHVIGNRAHDKAVEQRHRAAGTGTGEHPSCRQETEVLENAKEAVAPQRALVWPFGQRHGTGDACPRIRNGLVARGDAGALEPVLQIPDLSRYVAKAVHRHAPTS